MPNRFLPAVLSALLASAAAVAADTPAELVKRTYPVADLIASWPAPAAETPLGVFRPVTAPSSLPTPAVAPTVTPTGFPVPAAPVPPAPAPQPLPAPPAAVYPVQAVVPPPPYFPTPTPGKAIPASADRLVRLVTGMVRPYSWRDLGGTGTAAFDPVRNELVVCHTDDVHRDVSELLTALRRLQDKSTTQVVIETRVVEVPEAFFERLGANLGRGVEPVGADKPVLFLSEKEVRTFLEVVQADPRANVMMAPKMTACDGQPTVCQVGQSAVFQTGLDLSAGPGGVVRTPRYEAVELGTRIATTPTVSADRRFVRVRFRCETATVGRTAPVTPVVVAACGPEPGKAAPDMLARPAVDRQLLAIEAVIPDGGTALVVGPKCAREAVVELKPTVLSNILQLDRLFVARAVGREESRRLVLLTARVMTPPGEKAVAERCDCTADPCPAVAPAVVNQYPAVPAPAAAQCCPAATKPASPTDVLVQAAHPAGECKECKDCKSCSSLEAANLVKAYRKACADGKTEEALKLAMQALALDPRCFAGK